jgi:DNA-binding beta-propeller fold protein YncE
MHWRGWLTLTLCYGAALSGAAAGATGEGAPLTLEHRFDLPKTITGHFDHFAVDPGGKRLFGTAVEHATVVVFDFGTGKMITEIRGVKEPRAVLYRADLGRLYVSDGSGAMRVFDSTTYAPLQTLKIQVDADPIAYDPATQRLFVVNGGEKAKHTYSNITAFDTIVPRQIGDMRVDGIEVEGMTIEQSGSRLFANNRDKNQIDIFDKNTFEHLATWPVSTVRKNTVSALDESAHRLYVAGHQGQLVVMDSTTGKELQTLSIGDGADDISYDAEMKRIYVTGGGGAGSVDVFRAIDADHYRTLGRVVTAPGAATGRLLPQLGEYVVMAPAANDRSAQVLVYSVAAAK